MNKKFLADIQMIKNAMNTNKLVIFAGAGISIDAKVPSWSNLINEIKNELDLPENENDFLKIAQIYFNDRQEKEYIEKIRVSLGHKKLRYNEIHEELFELNPEHILTTNFEDLLEQVINKNSLPYSVIKEDKDLPYSENTKLLVKIHGDLDLGNLVFKEDDYLSYSQNHPLLDSFIKSIFSTKVVLFVGYSFNDNNLKQIIQYVRNILGKNFQNAYLLSVDNKVHQSNREYLKNKGINVINYFDANFIKAKDNDETIYDNYIYGFLKENNIYGKNSHYLKEINSLSEKGQLLLNFLRFIRFYDKLKIPVDEKNVIDQIYDSLIRFEEIKVLPQNFTSNLYPFRSSKEEEYLINYNALTLKNEHIANLFFDKIFVENSELKIVNIPDKYKFKIIYILQKLNNSLIYYVKRNFDENKPESKAIIFNPNHNQVCNCTQCKYERFQLKESLLEINNYNVTDTSDLNEDMQKAFLHHRFGNFFKSFKMYEEIASKAWLTQKYISYYIAKVNMKYLRGFFNLDSDLTKSHKKSIINKIEEIDIDKLIFLIPFRSKEEYLLLKIIRDKKILTETKEKIDKYYDEILDTYKLYQSKYSFSAGPYYPQLIYFELYKLLTFYNENYIIHDEFSSFKDIINCAVEALLISYVTDERYGGKLEEFDVDFFELTIQYIDSKKLNKVLEEYDIQQVKFRSENLEKIISYSNNFFSSYFNKFTNSKYTSKYDFVESQLFKKLFKNRTKVLFDNILIFLTLIEIEEKAFKSLKENIFTFLQYENFLYGDSIKYLKYFIGSKYQYITVEDCKLLLNLHHLKNIKYERYDFLGTIAKISEINNYEVIDNIEYVKKLLANFQYYDKHSKSIVYLWQMANREVKDYIVRNLEEKLKNDFDFELYKVASLSKMIDFNLYFDDFISYLNLMNKNNNIKENGYLVENEKPQFNGFQFHNDLLFLYRIGVKSNDVRLKKLKKLHQYMKFGIFRDKFDLSKFKIEWLFLFDSETFFNEFKKIKPLKKIIELSLKDNYDEELAKIYSKYFI